MMNDCMEREIREMLPDVLHGTLVPAERGRVDAHLAICGECRRELETLRAVRGAAVFAPSIDVDRIVRQITPYGTIVPAQRIPAASRAVAWLAAAGLVFVVAGGGSVLMSRTGNVETLPTVAASSATHSLALASGVEDLSDGGLEQLISELNGFDAIPADEPEPVLDVDAAVPLGQDSL